MDEIKEIEERWKDVDGFSETSSWSNRKTETPVIDLNCLTVYTPSDIQFLPTIVWFIAIIGGLTFVLICLFIRMGIFTKENKKEDE